MHLKDNRTLGVADKFTCLLVAELGFRKEKCATPNNSKNRRQMKQKCETGTHKKKYCVAMVVKWTLAQYSDVRWNTQR